LRERAGDRIFFSGPEFFFKIISEIFSKKKIKKFFQEFFREKIKKNFQITGI